MKPVVALALCFLSFAFAGCDPEAAVENAANRVKQQAADAAEQKVREVAKPVTDQVDQGIARAKETAKPVTDKIGEGKQAVESVTGPLEPLQKDRD